MIAQVPEELQPRKIWWECSCEIKCLCGAAQFVVTDEEDIRCDECGRVWGIIARLWSSTPVTPADVVKQHLASSIDHAIQGNVRVANPESDKRDFKTLAVHALRKHRYCGDAYPEDGWPEVVQALAQYAIEKQKTR